MKGKFLGKIPDCDPQLVINALTQCLVAMYEASKEGQSRHYHRALQFIDRIDAECPVELDGVIAAREVTKIHMIQATFRTRGDCIFVGYEPDEIKKLDNSR